ncbi:MAG TPA: hypothetical protein PK772_03230 [Chitinophagaceae bacterium]|nr:hypothetical protein [Chitinophagaceae bacterium]
MTANSLAGIILQSQNPEKLAQFYNRVLDIPFTLQVHGNIKEHYECLFNNIHFAILKANKHESSSKVIPSFRVNNLKHFIQEKNIKLLHPIIDLGDGKACTSIEDIDGNVIRLIQLQ